MGCETQYTGVKRVVQMCDIPDVIFLLHIAVFINYLRTGEAKATHQLPRFSDCAGDRSRQRSNNGLLFATDEGFSKRHRAEPNELRGLGEVAWSKFLLFE